METDAGTYKLQHTQMGTKCSQGNIPTSNYEDTRRYCERENDSNENDTNRRCQRIRMRTERGFIVTQSKR